MQANLRNASRHVGVLANLTVLFVVLSLTATARAVVPVANGAFTYGDVNGDGAVTLSDALSALRGAVGLTAASLRADVAPVNPDGTVGDGRVTLADVIGILRIVAGIEPARVAKLSLAADDSAPIAGAAGAAILPPTDIPLHLSVVNIGSQPVRLEYPGGGPYDFAVFNNAQEIWRWSRHQARASAPTDLVLKPGETRSFSAAWDLTDDSGRPVAPGEYQFLGELPTANGGLLISNSSPITVPGATGGLAVTLSTDMSRYRSGQPVQITMTETNTGKTDAKIYVGCPSYYDFWTTLGKTEVWRLSHGRITCLAIGLGVLHPGESRQLTATWTGEYNESPRIPVPNPATYEIHGVINEPGEPLTPTPVSIEVGDFATDYFPLAAGSAWTYLHRGSIDAVVYSVKQTITAVQTINGLQYSLFDHYAGSDAVLLRETTSGDVMQITASGEATRYKLNANQGDQWTFDLRTPGFKATMVSRDASLVTPYGSLSHLLEIAILTGVDTSETDYIAPGIGLVGVDNRVGVIVASSLRLQSYAPGGAAGSGIRGVAMEGPITPVCMVGTPCDKPLPGAIITVQPAGGGSEIARTVADSNGRFEISLPPGAYLIVPLPPTPGPLPRGASQTVTVPSIGFVDVIVSYDTGIR